MPAASLITAIVVAHDSAEVLPACLSALAAEGVPAIIADNASGDVSAAIARERGATVIASP
ncbi:MAG: glycosyl transferase, partial [Bosea sp. 32-68-6]